MSAGSERSTGSEMGAGSERSEGGQREGEQSEGKHREGEQVGFTTTRARRTVPGAKAVCPA